MDINVLLILMSFSLVLTVLGFAGKKPGWAFLPFFGSAISALTTLVLQSDGSVTQWQGSTDQTLAAANGNFVSDFNALVWMCIAITIVIFIIAIRRAFKL